MIEFVYKDEWGNIGIWKDFEPISLCKEIGWTYMREV